MSAPDEIEDSSAPLIEHLAELRTRLIRALMAFIVAMCICFAFADPIFNFLSVPVCRALADRGQDCSLVMIKLQEGFFVAIRISFLGGFALAFPYIGHQLWRFVAPGLYRSEKNAFLPFLIASPFMFLLGAAFAYYIILPMAFRFFLGYQQGIGPQAKEGAEALHKAGILYQGSIEEYLALTIKFIMAFGLCFQLPVLLTLMGKAGLVSSAGLGSVRKYAVVGILVLAAIATPPDVVSQIILFTVVYGLYEVSIFLVRGIEKRRAAAEAAEEADLYGTTPATEAAAETASPEAPAPEAGPEPETGTDPEAAEDAADLDEDGDEPKP
jgi:sec-independent protein translocase protein TatC